MIDGPVRAAGALSRRATRPLLLVVGLALFAAACQPSAPGRSSPAVFLEQHLEGGPGRRARPFCAIHDEFRPTIGCKIAAPLGRRIIPWPDSGETSVTVRVPEILQERRLLIGTRVRTGKLAGTVAMPALTVPRNTAEITVPVRTEGMEASETLAVRVLAHPIPRTHRHQTVPIRIPPGAEFTVGLGVEDYGHSAGLGTVRFLVSATDADDEKAAPITLLDAQLDAEALARGWTDRRADLAALEGRRMRFEFRTEVEQDFPGMLPIWGAPQINIPDPSPTRPNLLLISLDTFRADLLGLELDGRPITPFLNQLADEGLAFASATTTYSSTTASHMSMLTGLQLAVHGVDFPTVRMPDQIPTLASVLAPRGYETGAVTENGMINAASGFARGFRTYSENPLGESFWLKRNGIATTLGLARAWFERHRQERFFFFLHTYEVHDPFVPTEEFDVYGDVQLEDIPIPISKRWRHDFLKHAAEATFLDSELREFFEFLRSEGILENTIVWIVSDHGEGFGDGIVGHSGRLADPVMRIPLVAWNPALLGPARRIDTPVSLVDLVPTLLDYLELPPLAASNGDSFAAILRGAATTENPPSGIRFGEAPNGRPSGEPKTIVARSPTQKWEMEPVPGGEILVYDLQADRLERDARAYPGGNAEGEALRRRFLDEAAAARTALGLGKSPAPRENTLDKAATDRLRALGYIE